ncbi:unnamed protein product [Sympodiomycopsis kandeliae]
MAVSDSPQSNTSRRVILVSIYLLILAAFPFASRLTSVRRLPIDGEAINKRSEALSRTGCAVKIPATVSVQGLQDSSSEVHHHIQQWLHFASEADSNGVHGSAETHKAWCVDWQSVQEEQDSVSPLRYTIGNVSKEDGAVSLAMTLPVHPVTAHSLSLSIARRIALHLDLPFKSRLAQDSPIASGTSVQGQDLRHPEPEPEPEQHTTGIPQDDMQITTQEPVADLKLPDDQDVVQALLASSSSGDDQLHNSDLSISLPSHLLLHFHILNEDFSLSSAIPPISSPSFADSLRSELGTVQSELSDIVHFGLTTSWGIGKKTRDVHWQNIEWIAKRERREEVEMMELRDESYEEEIEETSQDGTTHTRTETRSRKVPHKVKRSITHIDEIPQKFTYLPSDQLEIFVDESGWDLTDQGQQVSTQQLDRFPYLWPSSDGKQAETIQLKHLHFVIYNPSEQHQPLLYLGDDEDDEEERSTEKAKELFSDPDYKSDHWGWVVPTWGGVIVHNRQTNNSGDNFSDEIQSKLLPIFQDQLRLLLNLPSSMHDSKLNQWHQKRNLIKTRTKESVETLQAIYTSISKLKNLEIDSKVQHYVSSCLFALHQIESGNNQIEASLNALVNSLSAYHHPKLLGILYFPMEHVYAVYTPLFGPLAVPLLLVGIKELKRIVKERKRKKKIQSDQKRKTE